MPYQDVYHITTFVPPDALKGLIAAIGKIVPLQYGRYEQVAWWSAPGTEQFMPRAGSDPALGLQGILEEAPSIRLEFVIPRDATILERVMTLGISPRVNHPWEEPVVLVEESRIVVRHPAARAARSHMRSHMTQPANSRTLDPSTTSALDGEQRRNIESVMEEDQKEPGCTRSFIYGRYWHPGVAATEELLAGLEHGNAWAVLTSSGMAAIDCALSVLQKSEATPRGPWMYPSELYGGTLKYFKEVLKKRRGIQVSEVTLDLFPYAAATEEFVKRIRADKPEVVFFEPITNPSLSVLDVDEVIRAGHEVGAKVIVDNTFATPLLCSPLKWGADLVVHSVTKSLSGHGNITAGLICGLSGHEGDVPCVHNGDDQRCGFRAAVLDHRKTIGCVLSPRDAFELAHEADTFRVRAAAANANALLLAELLESKIRKRVLYPGLATHPNHRTATKIFNAGFFGSMIAIELDDACDVDLFMDSLSENGIECRLTLGDLSTTFLPAARVFERFESYSRMLRISVGIEPFEKLQTAFERAFASSAAG